MKTIPWLLLNVHCEASPHPRQQCSQLQGQVLWAACHQPSGQPKATGLKVCLLGYSSLYQDWDDGKGQVTDTGTQAAIETLTKFDRTPFFRDCPLFSQATQMIAWMSGPFLLL